MGSSISVSSIKQRVKDEITYYTILARDEHYTREVAIGMIWMGIDTLKNWLFSHMTAAEFAEWSSATSELIVKSVDNMLEYPDRGVPISPAEEARHQREKFEFEGQL